jgi:hypothetical protein
VDFIERYFGISPDGGNGSVEFTLFVLLMAAIATAWFRATS